MVSAASICLGTAAAGARHPRHGMGGAAVCVMHVGRLMRHVPLEGSSCRLLGSVMEGALRRRGLLVVRLLLLLEGLHHRLQRRRQGVRLQVWRLQLWRLRQRLLLRLLGLLLSPLLERKEQHLLLVLQRLHLQAAPQHLLVLLPPLLLLLQLLCGGVADGDAA